MRDLAGRLASGARYETDGLYADIEVYPHWAPRMKKNTKIGLHVFYQFKRGWKFG